MIVCIGEILADMIGGVENGVVRFNRYAGSAPFNVACDIKKLGGKSGFVGCVGEDLIGRFLSDYADNFGFDYLKIRKDEGHNTTLAFVELDALGERKFSFYRKNTADYQIQEEDIEEAIEAADIVHLGSLMISEEQGRKLADAVVARTKAKGKILSFDVNYRDDIFSSEKEALAVYKKYVGTADIVKFSEEELLLFSGADNLENACRALQKKDQLMLVTLGKAGSLAVLNDKKCGSESIFVQVVDTTGAGDAFYAGALSKLDGKKLLRLTKEELEVILRFGNICGALTTSDYGAVNACPKLERVEKYMEE